MNERIKQLADQVWREILDETSIDGDISTTFSPDEVVAFEQKFAELIVKECLDIADQQKKWVEDMEVFNEQDATWNKARIQQSQRIVDKIKQHFGI